MSDQAPIPLGAQVVVREPGPSGTGPAERGAVGRVVQRRDGSYQVVLADGTRIEVRPDAVTLVGRREPEPEPRPFADSAALVTQCTIFAVLVSSSGTGTDDAEAGADVRGVYQAPTHTFWSLRKPPLHVAGPGSWFSWEIERFCQLALKANPHCLEMLWAPRPIWISEAGHELLDLRGAFLSQAISTAYTDHALTQFKKLDESDRERGEAWWREVAHVLRLLVDGIALLNSGDTGGVGEAHRERLVAARAGQLTWDQVEAWRLELQQEIEEAAATSFLPAEPDGERVSTWLRDLRRRDLARGDDER